MLAWSYDVLPVCGTVRMLCRYVTLRMSAVSVCGTAYECGVGVWHCVRVFCRCVALRKSSVSVWHCVRVWCLCSALRMSGFGVLHYVRVLRQCVALRTSVVSVCSTAYECGVCVRHSV